MPLGTRNWGGTEYHDSIFDPESQPQEYEQPYVYNLKLFWVDVIERFLLDSLIIVRV